ncbi:uncharacterized protein CC84DRAFT_1171571 [Paraphaeosphaeria sporulosa]|uniref:Uncharacterized protein n=1 Tax=Paraphaeosphaeria sporulosa TaxID=1460663 RepID=A0A177D1M1_9PLEO|nr:uncharacterized protein CC84DRAFT_1171571 [Paraphaeosphaeria sporulosa]OAG12929.1 hypothetical protein CC84DRAFT_1171571 [Paraphaeosphaeria sporulosa]
MPQLSGLHGILRAHLISTPFQHSLAACCTLTTTSLADLHVTAARLSSSRAVLWTFPVCQPIGPPYFTRSCLRAAHHPLGCHAPSHPRTWRSHSYAVLAPTSEPVPRSPWGMYDPSRHSLPPGRVGSSWLSATWKNTSLAVWCLGNFQFQIVPNTHRAKTRAGCFVREILTTTAVAEPYITPVNSKVEASSPPASSDNSL